jgi:hypothetical protein
MKKKKSLGRRVLGGGVTLVLLIAVVLCAVYISLNWDELKSYAPAFLVRLTGGAEDETGGKFGYEAYSDNVYSGLNDGLAVASGVGAEVFDRDGNLINRFSFDCPSPIMSPGKKNMAVWSVGGEEICLIDGKGKECYIKTTGLVSVSVNNSGWVSAVSGEQGYKGCVTIYDNKGQSVYKVYLGSGYPIDADVSPYSDSVAVLSLTENGSRLSVYSLDSEEEEYSWTSPGEVYFDAEYITDNRICLVSEDSVDFLDGGCAQVGSFKYTGEYLKDYTADGGYMALALGKYKTGNQGRIITLDTAGNQAASLDISREIVNLYAETDGRYLSAVYSDCAVIYTKDLTETGRVEDKAGIKAAVVRGDGSAIIISGYGANVYEPEK